jgi:hypothetical protein
MKRNKSMKMGRSMKRSGGQKMRGGWWPWDTKKEEVKEINPTMNPMHQQQQPNGIQQPTNPPQPESILNQASSLVSGAGNTVEEKLGSLQSNVTDTGARFFSNPLSFIPGRSDNSPSNEAVTPVANGQQTPVEEEKEKGLMSYFSGEGGRRRSRSMKMRGGLNQSFGYNAAPVMDSVTSEPTYMIKGGRRRRRSSRKRSCKKRRGCKRSCKRHRHKRR